MATLKALPRGTKLVLVAAPLLLVSLFFTWQNVDVDYGPAGIASAPLDGFDAWGLLLALLVATLLTIVILRELTEVEMSPDIPWEKITLGLGIAAFAVALAKNLLDDGSSWESYGFVALAGLVALGAYLDWRAARRPRRPAPTERRRGISSVA